MSNNQIGYKTNERADGCDDTLKMEYCCDNGDRIKICYPNLGFKHLKLVTET